MVSGFSILSVMMHHWRSRFQRKERIAIGQSPYNDFLHSIHTKGMNVMLQHHRDIMLGNSVNNILYHGGLSNVAVGIPTGHIPVAIFHAQI